MKVFLAGVCPDKIYNEYEGDKFYILQSFIDYRKGKKDFSVIQRVAKEILLDSGAFSMIYGSKKKIDFMDYAKDYTQFINKHKIENFFELDLYSIIGIPETEKIRNFIEQETGRQCIPVFHRDLKFDYYKKLIKEYNYIALGGIAVKGLGSYTPEILNKMIILAKQNNCKVHGLGFTSMKLLSKVNFDTVDSTSWLSPLRYGGVIDYFDGKVIKKIKAEKGQRIKTYNVFAHQLSEWLKFQKYMDR